MVSQGLKRLFNSFNEGFDSSDVEGVSHSLHCHLDSSIVMDLENLMGACPGGLHLVLCASPQEHFVTHSVGVGNPLGILPCIVLVDQLLFSLFYDFPVSFMLHVEDHVPAKHQLARGLL